VFAGCVTAPEPAINRISGASGSLTPGYDVVYYPQVPEDKTWGAVLTALQQTLRDTIWVYMGEDHLTYSRPSIVKNIAFQNNRVEILYQRVGSTDTRTFTLFYYQIMNVTIAAQAGRDGRRGRYAIIIPDIVTFRAVDLATTQRFADALFFRQQQAKNYAKQLDEQLARFEPVAAEYRALAVKPSVSEEQRKLFVQANALTQQKQYGKALAQYRKAIELDRTAYPEAYFNLALLAAQEHAPVTAIFYMRHYLLLRPDAKDARSAQDKIYEWEMLFQK
jgi:tetratricopeptide (TPR) repeat protein